MVRTLMDAQREGKCAVLKTSTRQTIFLPVIGLVDHKELKPGVSRTPVSFIPETSLL